MDLNGEVVLRSTGIEALDARLGGLFPGRYYLLWGPAGAGKTSAALHLLGAGLEEGEITAILTQDDPADLLAHAEYIGYEFRPAMEQDRLRLLKFRLDFQRNYSRLFDASTVIRELEELLAEPLPDRLVIDSIYPFLDGSHGSGEMLEALDSFLERYPGTVYLTVPGEFGDEISQRIYNRITAGAAGIFEFLVHEGRSRELAIRKVRQPAKFTDPFNYRIRPGAGIVEEIGYNGADRLPEEYRRRVMVLAAGATVPAELISALERRNDVTVHGSVESAFADLATGHYGLLLISLSPRDPEPALELTRSLRKAGNGAPILFFSRRQGLRSSTRAQGIRAGGDDFLTDALSPQELLERIESARTRGHRRILEGGTPPAPILQPVGSGGIPRAMTEKEFRKAIASKLEDGTEPFFALAVLDLALLGDEEAWRVLKSRVRITEGDLIATLDDGTTGLFLHDVGHEQAAELVARLGEYHPALDKSAVELFIRHPAEHEELRAWLYGSGTPVTGVPVEL